jgi:energy-converting hydrogenase Eha subunit H
MKKGQFEYRTAIALIGIAAIVCVSAPKDEFLANVAAAICFIGLAFSWIGFYYEQSEVS